MFVSAFDNIGLNLAFDRSNNFLSWQTSRETSLVPICKDRYLNNKDLLAQRSIINHELTLSQYLSPYQFYKLSIYHSIRMQDIGELKFETQYSSYSDAKEDKFQKLSDQEFHMFFPAQSGKLDLITLINFYSLTTILSNFGGTFKSINLILSLLLMPVFN